jgi:hypothetical protein
VGSVFDGIDARLGAWLERQPVFLVATAPLGADGHVNVSPKGTTGTLRVLDRVTVLADSCGYAVPRMSLDAERDVLELHHAKKGPQGLADCGVQRNAASIDGLPAWPVDEPAVG